VSVAVGVPLQKTNLTFEEKRSDRSTARVTKTTLSSLLRRHESLFDEQKLHKQPERNTKLTRKISYKTFIDKSSVRTNKLDANRGKSTDGVVKSTARVERKIISNRRRKITPELRDFWLKLDQRKANDKNTNKLNRNDPINGTGSDPIFEDFPFLSDDFDYSNYYYYDYPDETISSSNSTLNTSTVDKDNIIASSVHKQEHTVELDEKSNESVSKLQGRKATSPVIDSLGFDVVPTDQSPIPMTAEVSFLTKRQNNNRDKNKPRDILKEFPIFRQLKRNLPDSASFRKISLHERLSNRFTPVSPSTEIPMGKVDPIAIEIELETTSTTPAPTSPSSLTSTPTTTSSTTTTTEIGSTTTNKPLTNSTLAKTIIQTSTETSFDGIQKEVTFSTSKTSSLVSTVDAVFQSQLGVAPEGESPFGVAPFGESPMGELPFGVAPGGIAPHGNVSVVNSSANIDDNIPGEDDRYHVQVVSPDGSINGDYVVKDPVTGDLNGVRYEAAQDVDPKLVQRILLNFLSLDPRFTSNLGDDLTTDPTTEEIVGFETTISPHNEIETAQTSSQSFPDKLELIRPPESETQLSI